MEKPIGTQGVKINNLYADSTAITCECGSELFTECIRVRRLSRLLTGEPEDRIFPLPVVVCKSCGKELAKPSSVIQ